MFSIWSLSLASMENYKCSLTGEAGINILFKMSQYMQYVQPNRRSILDTCFERYGKSFVYSAELKFANIEYLTNIYKLKL